MTKHHVEVGVRGLPPHVHPLSLRSPGKGLARHVIFALLLLSVPSAGCRPAPPWKNREGPLILVTVDTLRADHLSCYGYPGLSTPNMDRLASEGVRFTDASCTMPMTLPSHASILTGCIPPVHGVRDNQDFILSQRAVTLAERFSSAGFATAAFVSSRVLDRHFGLAQGFDTYGDRFPKGRNGAAGLDLQKTAAEVTEEALRWLRSVGTDRFFLWIHYFDPHRNYDPPPEFLPGSGNPYDGEIAFVDDRLGRLLRELERRGLYDKATLVFTADHGEALGDHGELTHGFLAYQPTLHVPLMIKSPGIVPGRVTTPVSTADLFPTLCDLFGLAWNEDDVDGCSLLPLLQGKPVERKRPVYFETYLPALYLGWSGLRGIRAGPYKYIESSAPELYLLTRDPGERRNLLAEEKNRVENLARRLALLRREAAERALRSGAPAAAGEDRERMSALAALGYIGGARLEGDALERTAGRVAPAPRVADYESFLSDYQEGRTLEFAGRYARAAERYEGAAARGLPYYRIADIHASASRCRLAAGEPERAAALARKALACDPGFIPALLALGRALDALGRPAEADRYYVESFRKAAEQGLPPPPVNASILKRVQAELQEESHTEKGKG